LIGEVEDVTAVGHRVSRSPMVIREAYLVVSQFARNTEGSV